MKTTRRFTLWMGVALATALRPGSLPAGIISAVIISAMIVPAMITPSVAYGQDEASAGAKPQTQAQSQTQSPKQSPPATPDLGEGLLDELTGDLFEGFEREVQQGRDEAKSKPQRNDQAEPDQVAPVPLPGEDIGEASNPLLEIGRLMQRVERRLAGHDPGEQTQSEQQQILEQLARLIEQAQQPSQSDPSNNQPPQKAEGSQGDQPSQSQEGSTAEPQEDAGDGNTAGSRPTGTPMDSEEGVREAAVEQADPVSRSALIKDTWGHLPPHLREAMLNVPTGEYLPQYAPLIEQYFKRLAEQYRQRP